MSAFELITGWAAIGALREDWERLWRADRDAYFSQSFAWCVTRWEALEAQERCTCICIVGRDEGRVTLIWPLIIRREGVWRIARPLDQVTTEYSSVLTENVNDQERVAEAWCFARANAPCDLFI